MTLFHPFQFQYSCTLVEFHEEYALLRAEKGPLKSDFFFPRALLPRDLSAGDLFVLALQPQEFQEGNNEKELACMQAMLQKLLQ